MDAIEYEGYFEIKVMSTSTCYNTRHKLGYDNRVLPTETFYRRLGPLGSYRRRGNLGLMLLFVC